MQDRDWARIAELYSQIMDLEPEARPAEIERLQLNPDERALLDKLMSPSQETGFFETGGAVSDQDVVLPTGTEIGNWRVRSVLGTGGMGEVYEVERADGHYEQLAALKRIPLADQDGLARFQRERQVLAKLEHPNIARLIDGGVGTDDIPYLVMERIEGVPIDTYVAENALTQPETLRLFLKACAAVTHAHGQLILHRDLKPSNILVTRNGEVKLIDFGVAGLIDESDIAEKSPMTMAFAAPEQISQGPVSAATDVFGLGATLVMLLLGEPPQPAEFRTNQLKKLPYDLCAILDHALAETPDARYASVEALAGDIRHFLTHEPISARPGGFRYEAGLFLRRNWLASTAAIAVISALSLGLAGTVWQAEKAQRERDAAIQERERLRAMQQATFVMFSEAGNAGGELDARDLVTKSANRMLEEFDDDPAGAAPVLHMYGELFYLMNAYSAAEPLLTAVADMQETQETADLIALASHDLANVLMRTGDVGEARRRFDAAKTYWQANPLDHQEVLLDSVLVESQLLAQEGKVAEAEALLTEALPARIAYSGETSMDTAILYTNIGVARMRIGDLEGAIEASENGRDAFKAVDRLESPDGLNTLNNLATLYHITGRLDEAERAYAETMETRQSLYGPSAALAVLLSNYAKLRILQENFTGAIELFDQAIPMAEEFSGADSPPALAARFGKIEALAKNGATAAALKLAADTDALMTDPGLRAGIYGGLLNLSRGEAFLLADDPKAARANLDRAEAILKDAGPAAGRHLAKIETLRTEIAAITSPN